MSLGSYISEVPLEGTIRLAVENNSGTRIAIVKEFRTENLRGSTTDRQQQMLLPEQRPMAKEDSKLVVYFKPNTDDVSVGSGSLGVMLISTTRYIK